MAAKTAAKAAAKSKLIPLADRVVITPLKQDEVTASGLVIPDTAKEKPQQGEVIAVGPGRLDDSGKRIPLDVGEIRADLLSLSGHKIYGPKGIGALYLRRRPRVRLAPLFSGGGQERGLRSGTLPAPLIVGFGEAARIAAAEGLLDAGRIAGQRDRFLAALRAEVPEVALNGSAGQRVAGNLNLSFPGPVTAQAIMAAAPSVCVSTGSACSSAEVEPSYVLKAIGLPEAQARATLRIGIGRFTSPADVDQAAAALAAAWRHAVSEARNAAE